MGAGRSGEFTGIASSPKRVRMPEVLNAHARAVGQKNKEGLTRGAIPPERLRKLAVNLRIDSGFIAGFRLICGSIRHGFAAFRLNADPRES